MKRINWGNDSTVYLSQDGQNVIKIYDMLEEKVGKEKALRLLQRYHDDTLRAGEILGNACKTWAFRLETPYRLNIIVVPQGQIGLQSLPDTDMPPRIHLAEKECITSTGQRYIPGLTVDGIIDGYNHNDVSSTFHRSINLFESSIKGTTRAISETLSKSLKVSFDIDYINVKPVMHESKQTIDLIITDLAGNITTTYR